MNGPTRGQAAGRNWRRTSHGFYVPADVDGESVDQRILEASVVVPPAGAITGWAALRWCGGRWFEGTDATGEMLPVDVLISTHDIRPQPGIKPCGEGTSPARDIIVVDGVPVTAPVWSTVFAMRYAGSARRAGLVLEMAAYDDLSSIAEATALIANQRSWTGVPVARAALSLAGENSWSPAEYFLKLHWVEAGFPCPLQNVPVFDLAGRHIGTPDLLDPVAGVFGEYDGADHLRPEQRVIDVRRAARFAQHHLEGVTMLAGDTPSHFEGRLREAYRRAGRRRTRRTWSIEPPAWWVPTRTVDQRRALTPDQRARFLRYRSA